MRVHVLQVKNMTSLSAAEAWCKSNASCIGFTTRVAPDPTTHQYHTYFKQGASNLNTDPKWTSYVKAADAPAGPGSQQVWAKPQPGGAVAVVMLNGGGADRNTTMQSRLLFKDIGLVVGAGGLTLRNIWEKKDVAQLPPGTESFEFPSVAPRSSSFWLLTPKN